MANNDYFHVNNLLTILAEKTEPLTKEEEHRLIEKFQKEGDNSALEKLVLANLRFVLNIINKFKRHGIPVEDLLHEGILGLIEAAKRFDTKRDIKFISYAVWWIKQAVINALANETKVFKLPPKMVRLMIKMTELQKESLEKNKRQLTEEELLEKMKISKKTLLKIQNLLNGQVSLSTKINADGSLVVGDTVKEKEDTITGDSIITRILLNEIKEVIKTLKDKERDVLMLRYGFDGSGARSLGEVGKILSISRERVRQLEKRAMEKIREHFKKKIVGRDLN